MKRLSRKDIESISLKIINEYKKLPEIAGRNLIRAVDGGTIEIKGTKTKWRYGVVPDNANQGCMPEISDSHFILDNV